jgi:hypothetical protein
MKFNAKDLRNGDRVLLRRLERQRICSQLLNDKKITFDNSKTFLSDKKITKIEEPILKEETMVNGYFTKLGLYSNRRRAR